MSDLYDELGVGPDASQDEIEAAGKRRIKETHPDAGGSPAAFDRTMRALTVLRDPLKRERYDTSGETSEEPENLMLARAMQIVTARFQAFIQNPHADFARLDPLRDIRGALKGEITTHGRNIADTENAINRLKKARERLELKAQGKQDWLGPAIDHQIRQYELGIARVRDQIRTLETALEILDDYGWRLDPEPTYQDAGGSWGPTTTMPLRAYFLE